VKNKVKKVGKQVTNAKELTSKAHFISISYEKKLLN